MQLPTQAGAPFHAGAVLLRWYWLAPGEQDRVASELSLTVLRGSEGPLPLLTSLTARSLPGSLRHTRRGSSVPFPLANMGPTGGSPSPS